MSTLALPLLCSALLISELHRCFRLWHPEPDRRYPPEYRNGGLQIGDVGFVNSNGRFMVTFNICRPADHALRSTKGVPKVFQQISVSHDDITGEADDIGSCLITPSSLIDKRGIVERSTTASRERTDLAAKMSEHEGSQHTFHERLPVRDHQFSQGQAIFGRVRKPNRSYPWFKGLDTSRAIQILQRGRDSINVASGRPTPVVSINGLRAIGSKTQALMTVVPGTAESAPHATQARSRRNHRFQQQKNSGLEHVIHPSNVLIKHILDNIQPICEVVVA
ncbi:hypothetical protein J3A83DRAFT_4368177 [Scleroderma citrinum]